MVQSNITINMMVGPNESVSLTRFSGEREVAPGEWLSNNEQIGEQEAILGEWVSTEWMVLN